MKKYGIIGAERTGKTTLAYSLAAYISQTYSISTHVLSESLLRNPELELFNETNQYIFLFDQMIQELKLESTLNKREIGRDIVITDRTPLDFFPYLCEISPYTHQALYSKTKDMVMCWLGTFKILLYVDSPLYINGSFDTNPVRRALWNTRCKRFKELINEISNVDIIHVNTIFKTHDYPIEYISKVIHSNYIGE